MKCFKSRYESGISIVFYFTFKDDLIALLKEELPSFSLYSFIFLMASKRHVKRKTWHSRARL